jgi:Leucine-rich repeat (LRR) protein
MSSGWLRKHLRISLRSMMLLPLLFGVWLGWRVMKAREQREVVGAVKRYGGWIHYDYDFVSGKPTPGREPRAPQWLRRVLGDEFFQEVRHVSLAYDNSTGKQSNNSNVSPCDDLLARLARQSGLKFLLLKKSQATDGGLKHIGAMTGLEELYIWDATAVTDAGVAHLARLNNLKKIHINGSKITDESLVLLSSLPSIESLSLQENHFSDKGFSCLKGEKRLKDLWAGLGDLQVTDAGLVHLKDFKYLQLLDLQNSKISAQGLEQLRGLSNLKSLWLGGTAVTKLEKQHFQQAMPNLKVVR